VEEIEKNGREGFGGLTFLNNTKLSSFGNSKIVSKGDFGGFYINSSNLIYFIIIFLKLKI